MQSSHVPRERAASCPSASDLEDAVPLLSRTSVLLVGDVMLDRVVFGEIERISREAPIPILKVSRETAVPGGAGSVLRSLGALGAAVAFVSVVGDDAAGSELTGLIGGHPGVEPWLLVQGGRRTVEKTRFIADSHRNHPLLRADRASTGPITPGLTDRLVRIACDAMAATSITVLSDFGKGVLAGDVPSRLIAVAGQMGRRIIADLRGDYPRYAGADVVITSRRDFARFLGAVPDTEAAFAAAADEVRRRHHIGCMLLMSPEAGITLLDGTAVQQFPIDAPGTMDLAGAGEAAVAVVAAALAARFDIAVAARLATAAAGIALGRVGSALVRPADLLAALSPQAGALNKIVAHDQIMERLERWRRRGWTAGLVNGRFDPLQPGQIHLLEQTRAACDRLVVGLYRDGPANGRDPVPPAQPEAVRAARLASLACVDLVVIIGENDSAELIRIMRPDILAGPRCAAEADQVRRYGGLVVQNGPTEGPSNTPTAPGRAVA
jgi:D-beta-D-heptose 7-phosphate kinase/D-beta-D-heptose 1-phosphate adenosyltransferase